MMMSDNHIDSMFRQLQNLESEPSPRVWQNIGDHLDGKKKKRIVPLFWRLGMAASVLLVIGLFLFIGSNRNQDLNQTARLSETEELTIDSQDEKMIPESVHDKSSDPDHSNLVTVSKKIGRDTEWVNTDESNAERGVSPWQLGENALLEGSMAATERQVPESEKLVPLQNKPTLTYNIHPDEYELAPTGKKSENNYFYIPEKETEKNRFPIRFILGGEYSPTYAFRDVSGSDLDAGSERGMMTSGGGFSLAMKVNKRWQIETGIKYAMLGQEVSTVSRSNKVFNVSSVAAESNIDITEVSLVNSLGTVNPDISPKKNSDSRAFQSSPNELVELQTSNDEMSGNPVLEQNLGYIRVPVTLRYQLLESGSIGLSLAGGVSTNWLIDNNAYLETAGQKQRIGETDGLSKVGLSTHAGLAVAVPLYKGFRLRMEPRIDYFISDISREAPGNFRPYSFGVFTGLFYEW